MTKYIYEGKTGYEWLDAPTALEKAIVQSLTAGWREVPMTVEDFRTVMDHGDPEDERSLNEQLLAFASNCGLRFAVANHGQDVRFWV
jgi:hypothetical protein